MESVGIGNSKDWGEEQKVRIERERKALTEKINTLSREIEKLGEKKEQMQASFEREKDPEIDPEFPRMVERAMRGVLNKQEELKKRKAELITMMNELEHEERQLKAVMDHENYPKWVELMKRRDEAVEEVKRLEAEMKRLWERIVFNARLK